jgi:hypothetical protein
MNKLRTHLIIIILTFAAGISAASGWIYFQKSAGIQIIIPNARWEQFFFRSINDATEKAQLPRLRKVSLYNDDIEVRIWRGFGLSNLEAVILKRRAGKWSASHLKADTYIQPFENVEVKELDAPKSGWDSFWNQMNERKLLELPDASEIGCDIAMIDGVGHVVEINRNRIYRTYLYQSGTGKCREAQLMDEIGEIIGLEFDSGNEQCKTTEWFACMTFRKKLPEKNK